MRPGSRPGRHRRRRAALLEWLSTVTASAATIRGLAIALTRDNVSDPAEAHQHCASAQLTQAGAPLVRCAVREGAVAPDVTVTDLLALITGIGLATEQHPDPAAEANRLLNLTIAGVSPTQVRAEGNATRADG